MAIEKFTPSGIAIKWKVEEERYDPGKSPTCPKILKFILRKNASAFHIG